MSLYALRSFAAHVLAKAALDMFPGTQLIVARAHETGFYAEFEFPQALSSDMLCIFEEKMRAIFKERLPIRIQEMVPHNAAALFHDKKQPFLEEACLESEEELVQVCVIGNYYGLLEGAWEDNIPAFKLLSFEVADGISSITGTAMPTLQELKPFIKRLKEAEKRDWKKRGVNLGYVALSEDGLPLILPKGVEVLETFKTFWRDSLQNYQSYPVCTREVDQFQAYPLIFKAMNLQAGKKGILLYEWNTKEDVSAIFTKEGEAECKSSLQLIAKTIKMLEFEYRGILCGLTPKGKRDCWIQGIRWLKEALASEKISYEEDETFPSEKGPSFEVIFYDSVGRTFKGPRLGVDCLAAGKSDLVSHTMITRTLFPNLDELLCKWIEAYS